MKLRKLLKLLEKADPYFLDKHVIIQDSEGYPRKLVFAQFEKADGGVVLGGQ